MDETKVGNKILVARHLVGLAVAMLMVPPLESGAYWIGWVVNIVFIPLLSICLAGLIWLFFTETQRPHTLRNFIRSIWLLAFFVAVGGWQTIWPDARYVPFIALVAYFCAKAYAKRKKS